MARKSRGVGGDVLDATADRLHSAAIHLLRRLRRVDEGLGVSPARLSVLSVLVFGGPRTLGALARAEQVSPPTMTRLIQRLEAEKLVLTSRDADDRRVVHVAATPAGSRLLWRGRRDRVAELSRLMRGLPDADRAAMDRAAMAIGRMLESPRSGRAEAGRERLGQRAAGRLDTSRDHSAAPGRTVTRRAEGWPGEA